jgi:type IV secretion system protein TrbL
MAMVIPVEPLLLMTFVPLQLGLGDLPENIIKALFGGIADLAENIAVDVSTALTDVLIKGLLKVPNPYDSSTAGSAWTGIFEISLVLLPIMIALALIAWPFSEDRESGLMDLVVRLVMVLLFIGISQPAWGFAIDATNAVTVAILDLDPSASGVDYGYGNGLLGSSATAGTWALKFIVSLSAAILAVLALILSIFFLLLRWFMVWMAYIGTPFFAVVWFVGRGPLKSVGSVGATFMRMGVFSLLAGPVIAIFVLTFQVIEAGAILSTSSGGLIGDAGLLFAELSLMMIFPILLIVTIWKLISWAGQPIGAGEAAAVTTLAVTAAVGGAVLGAVGGGGAAAGGAAGGSGGSGAAAGGSAGGASGGSASASASGASAGGAGSANVGAGGSGLASRMTTRAKGMAGSAKKAAGRQVAKKVNHVGTKQKLDEARSSLNAAQQDEQAAASQAKFLQNSMASGDMDMAEAKEQGIIDAEPVEGQTPKFKTDPLTNDVKMTYMGTDGAPRAVNLTQKYKSAKAEQRDAGQEAEAAQSQIDTIQKRKRRVDTGRAAGRVGRAGARPVYRGAKFATRTGGAAMIGGVGGNSYLAHSMGRRASQPMIRSGSPNQNQNQNHTLSEYGRVAGGQASKTGEIGNTGNSDNSGGF